MPVLSALKSFTISGLAESGLRRGLASTAALVMLTACVPSDEQIATQTTVPTCPLVAAVADWDRLTVFRAESAVDITDITYEARITSVRGSCYFQNAGEMGGWISQTMWRVSDEDERRNVGQIITDFGVEVEVVRGPAGETGAIVVPLRMLLVDAFGRVQVSKDFDAEFQFEDNYRRATWRSEYDQVLPAKGPAGGAGWEVLVAIRLTPEQLEYNKNN